MNWNILVLVTCQLWMSNVHNALGVLCWSKKCSVPLTCMYIPSSYCGKKYFGNTVFKT